MNSFFTVREEECNEDEIYHHVLITFGNINQKTWRHDKPENEGPTQKENNIWLLWHHETVIISSGKWKMYQQQENIKMANEQRRTHISQIVFNQTSFVRTTLFRQVMSV